MVEEIWRILPGRYANGERTGSGGVGDNMRLRMEGGVSRRRKEMHGRGSVGSGGIGRQGLFAVEGAYKGNGAVSGCPDGDGEGNSFSQ